MISDQHGYGIRVVMLRVGRVQKKRMWGGSILFFKVFSVIRWVAKLRFCTTLNVVIA